MAHAYLGLGGNVGDSRAFFKAAIEKLKAHGTVDAVSSLYRTEPVDSKDQEWFLNCALIFETERAPEQVLVQIKKIEKELGRTPSHRNGPREIDIDILLYDDVIMHTDTLTIPHPRMHERRFVLAPLADIALHVRHPILNKTVAELLHGLVDSSIVRRV